MVDIGHASYNVVWAIITRPGTVYTALALCIYPPWHCTRRCIRPGPVPAPYTRWCRSHAGSGQPLGAVFGLKVVELGHVLS